MADDGEQKKVGLGIVPPRIQYVMDRHELTGGKITQKQRQALNHHYLLQRDFENKAKLAVKRQARNKSADDGDEDDDEDGNEEEQEDGDVEED